MQVIIYTYIYPIYVYSRPEISDSYCGSIQCMNRSQSLYLSPCTHITIDFCCFMIYSTRSFTHLPRSTQYAEKYTWYKLHTHTHTHTHTHIRAHTHIHTYTNTYICVHIHTKHTYIHVYNSVYISLSNSHSIHVYNCYMQFLHTTPAYNFIYNSCIESLYAIPVYNSYI